MGFLKRGYQEPESMNQKKLIDLLPANELCRILDVGCGNIQILGEIRQKDLRESSMIVQYLTL